MTSNDPLESVTLTFPPGAVDTNTTVTYTHHTSPPATISTSSSSDLQGIGVYFDLEAEQGGVPVTSFNLPVTLTVRYLTSGAVDPNTLGLFRYDGGSGIRMALPSLHMKTTSSPARSPTSRPSGCWVKVHSKSICRYWHVEYSKNVDYSVILVASVTSVAAIKALYSQERGTTYVSRFLISHKMGNPIDDIGS